MGISFKQQLHLNSSETSRITHATMNFYLSVLLTSSLVLAQSTGFKIDTAKDPQALANKIALKELSTPTVTEIAPGKFHVRLGEREPVVLSTHEEDCGSFSYPANGGHYQNNEDVVFLVNPHSSGPREVSFTRFNTEFRYDYVSVFLWQNNQFVLAGRYSSGVSGSDIAPSAFTAPEGRFLIAFTSDSSVTNTGFTVTWYNRIAAAQGKNAVSQEKDATVIQQRFALEDQHAPVITETAEGTRVQLGSRSVPVVQVSADCRSFGSFSYPDNGANYQNNEDIAFLIIPESGGPREIAFSNFDVENGFDYVSVHVWENNQFRLVGRFTGSRPDPIVAPNGRTLVSFISDPSVVRSGFTALWYERN